MPSQTSSPKKQRLTLAQLHAYDDILTDALVDHVFYWTSIRKNRSAYHSSRGVREEDVTNILRNAVIIEKNPAKAESQLMTLSGLKKFSENLTSDKEKEDFRRHLRKYINIYMPDCPFEVSSTNRYTVVTHEAAITARKFIKKGDVIKYLCGIQVIMTPEEEAQVNQSRRDFSIVVSSRNKAASLFLGPARFANHDCGANAKLITTGSAGMEIIAVKDIEIGDEITVTYGDNYFGEDNCECLCKTCEDLCQNGWQAEEGEDGRKIVPALSIEEQSGDKPSYSFRARRRSLTTASSRTTSMTPDVNIRPVVSKRTPKSLSRFKNLCSSSVQSPSSEPALSPMKRKRGAEEGISSDPLKKRRTEQPIKVEESTMGTPIPTSIPESPASSVDEPAPSRSSSSGLEGPTETDATSVEDEDTIIVKIPSSPSKLKKAAQPADPLEEAKSGAPILIGASTNTEHPAVQDDQVSELSDLGSDMELNDSTMSITSKKSEEPKSKKKIKAVLPKPTTDRDHAPAVRVAGDYVLTPALLTLPASAWINCKICEESFVQENSYFTKSSCPRCERHSKLYGYMWPKTDKEGKHDEEERVTDHRTVHRFIKPHEERLIRKRDGTSDIHDSTREVSEAIKEEKIKNWNQGKGWKIEQEKLTELAKLTKKGIKKSTKMEKTSAKKPSKVEKKKPTLKTYGRQRSRNERYTL